MEIKRDFGEQCSQGFMVEDYSGCSYGDGPPLKVIMILSRLTNYHFHQLEPYYTRFFGFSKSTKKNFVILQGSFYRF